MNSNPIVYAQATPQPPTVMAYEAPAQVVAQVTGYTPPSSGTAPFVHSNVVSATSITPESLKTSFNTGAALEVMIEEGFPAGLQEAFNENLSRIPLRFFILDDSGSMMIEDGSMMHESNGKKCMVKCTRWGELTNAVKFHVKMARAAEAPCEFRLLNGAHALRIGFTGAGDAAAAAEEASRVTALYALLDDSPGGGTPLCKHVREVIAEVRKVEHQLRSAGKKACVVIATDGQPSDGDVAEAMRPLKDLPVLVVLRLCTSEDAVVEYWNNIDQQLELNMDVLDDLAGEAAELRSKNPWLTYGVQLHRLREFGNTVKEFDLLDEKKLSKEQLRKVCKLIYGGSLDDYPHPEADFGGFEATIKAKNRTTAMTWDTQTRRDRHWVDVGALHAEYSSGCCSIC